MIKNNPGDIVLIREMLDDIEQIHFEVTNAARLDEGFKFLVKHIFNIML